MVWFSINKVELIVFAEELEMKWKIKKNNICDANIFQLKQLGGCCHFEKGKIKQNRFGSDNKFNFWHVKLEIMR